jgi:hypothetical protein
VGFKRHKVTREWASTQNATLETGAAGGRLWGAVSARRSLIHSIATGSRFAVHTSRKFGPKRRLRAGAP